MIFKRSFTVFSPFLSDQLFKSQQKEFHYPKCLTIVIFVCCDRVCVSEAAVTHTSLEQGFNVSCLMFVPQYFSFTGSG